MNRVVHFEFVVTDPDKTAAFLQAVFGWSIRRWPGPQEYWLAETGPEGDAGINGGIVRSRGNESLMVTTVEVADLDACLASIQTHGGTVVVPKHPIPGVGWLAYAKDPCGVVFGVTRPDPAAT